jgi:hypothetical protein
MARTVGEKIVAAKKRTDPANRPFRGHFTIWCQDSGEAMAIMGTVADVARGGDTDQLRLGLSPGEQSAPGFTVGGCSAAHSGQTSFPVPESNHASCRTARFRTRIASALEV